MKLFFIWWLLSGIFKMPAAKCEHSRWRAGHGFSQPLPQEVMVDAVNYIGLLLLNAHNQNNENNIAFSPYGATSVLVALGEGVQGAALDEILRSTLLPVDASVMRVGLRDIHRHLKSYFIPQEGFLAGLTFSHDNVTLRPSYESILKFYGYDTDSFNNALYPDPYSTTTAKPSTSPAVFSSPVDGANSSTTTLPSTIDEFTTTATSEVVSESTTPITSTTDTSSTETPNTFASDNTMPTTIMTTQPVPDSTVTTLADSTIPTTITTIKSNDVTISTETTQETISTAQFMLKEETSQVTTGDQNLDDSTSNMPTTAKSTTNLQDITTSITTNEVSTIASTTSNANILVDGTTTATPTTVTTTLTTETSVSTVPTTINVQSTDATTAILSTVSSATDIAESTPSTEAASTEATTTEAATTESATTETPTIEIATTEAISTQSTLTSDTASTEVATGAEGTTESMSTPLNDLLIEPASSDTIDPVASNTEGNDTEAQKNKRMVADIADVKLANLKTSLGNESNRTDGSTTKKDIFHHSSASLLSINSSSVNYEKNVNVGVFTKIINSSESIAALNLSSPGVEDFMNSTDEEEYNLEDTAGKLSLEELFSEMKDDFGESSKEVDETKARQARSVIDYLIAKYHDNNPPHNYFTGPTGGAADYEPEKPTTFAVNGKVREPNISFMTYDAVLPYRYVSYLNALALTFPLDSSSYYLLLVLPVDETGIDTLVSKMMTTTLKQIIYSLQPARVKATIPSFMLKGYVVLTPTLQKLGIRRIFEPRHTDFSRMTADKDIYVTNIEQAVTVTIRNYIDPSTLQNNGQMLRRRSPVKFTADHPFLYFVMDSQIHVALMAGKIINPLNSRIR